jgi:hypothetical protein
MRRGRMSSDAIGSCLSSQEGDTLDVVAVEVSAQVEIFVILANAQARGEE